MFQPLYNGAAGLSAQQKNIDVIGNNIANVSTNGYKATRIDFEDNLYTKMWNFEDNSAKMNLQRGTGVHSLQTKQYFSQGELTETLRNLDLALEGYGFYVLENEHLQSDENAEAGLPPHLYSRDASFYLVPDAENPDANGGWLVNAQGNYVLSRDEERIYIPDPDSMSVNEKGEIYSNDEDGEYTYVAQLWVVDFSNPGGLESVGENSYIQTVNSGTELETENYLIHQGFVEVSNVDLANEMTRLVRAQRSYQLAARAVTTADQMLGIANQITS